MARKTLLTESEVRRFMKLANMGPLGAKRLEEISYLDEAGEEELRATEDELGAEDAFADEEGEELGAEEEEPMDDLGGEEEMEGEVDPELEDKLKAAIEAIAAEWGIEDSVSVEEAPGDEEAEMGMPGEEEMEVGADLEMGPEGGEELEMGAEEEVEEPVPGMRNAGVYQEALVAKVARRVAHRLMQEQKSESLADQLTDRIFKRITSK
jgi:hypothetical protein